MTDFKKLEQVSEQSYPEFKYSRKGGYVEDQVDETVKNIFNDVNKVIVYQNQTVDALVAVEGERDAARTEVLTLTDRLAAKVQETEQLEGQLADVAAVTDAVRAETENQVADLQKQLAAAQAELANKDADLSQARNAVVTVVEAAPVSAATPGTTFEEEAYAATSLLVAAEKTAKAYIAEAKEKAEALVAGAEVNIDDLREEVVLLKASRDAALETLREFHLEQLENLTNLTHQVRAEDVVVEQDADVAAEADLVAEAEESVNEPAQLEVVEGEPTDLADDVLETVAEQEDYSDYEADDTVEADDSMTDVDPALVDDEDGVDDENTFETVSADKFANEPVSDTENDEDEDDEDAIAPQVVLDDEAVEEETSSKKDAK